MRANELTKKQVIKTLTSLLSEGTEFVYLFGSFAKDSTHPMSDIDVGVYFKDLPPSELQAIREKLTLAFAQDVDIIDMQHADPIIVMQILTNGVLIVQNSPALHAQYVSLRLAEYFDLKMSRKIIEDNLLRGMRHA